MFLTTYYFPPLLDGYYSQHITKLNKFNKYLLYCNKYLFRFEPRAYSLTRMQISNAEISMLDSPRPENPRRFSLVPQSRENSFSSE